MTWWQTPTQPIDQESRAQASARQNQLTKPAGSLGVLEELAISFSGWQGQPIPELERIRIRVFAADHGVVAEGVSAFPQIVTAEMVRNFSRGGAAISVLARQHQADFAVVNAGVATPLEALDHVVATPLTAGTANIVHAPAMTEAQVHAALALGRKQIASGFQLFIGGEMGIGNTTSAAALTSALLGLPAEITVGRGTGIDDAALARKRQVVNKALSLHQDQISSPISALQCLGGLEIAAMTGAYIAAAQQGVPILVDGYISSVAALLACRLNADVRDWMLFGHRSVEPGHTHVLQAMDASPLLNLGMRLGEGSGAAVAIPLLQTALKLHAEMATFSQADVSESARVEDELK